MKRLIAYFANQTAFVNLITVVVLTLGIYSLVKIKREVFPNINFDVITITTPFPGASASSVERLITNPLEQDLSEVDGIKKMTSISAEGTSVIVMQLDPDQVSEAEAEADIQDVVDAFRDLPEDAEDPIVVVAESKMQPTIKVSVSGENVSEDVLRATSKNLERELEKLSEVAKVNYDGLRDYEVRVEASPEKMQKYQISLTELIGSLRRSNLNIPGGTIEASLKNPKEIIVRTIGEFEGPDDVGNTVVRSNALAESIRVKDVARVEQTFEKRKIALRTNGAPSINLTVLKKERADAITLVDRVKETMEALKPTLAEGVEIDYIADTSYFVRRRLKVLSSNLAVGLALVLIVLSLMLPFRVALVTAFGIPFSFLGALSIFYFGDVSLNLISMMGLIIVVGMLVDDAVVVTENAQTEMEEGFGPLEAAIKGTQGIWAPVMASVLTTVIAFAPMMFMSGIFGKFIKYIPLGVIIALLVSLAEVFFILPHHLANWVKPVVLHTSKTKGFFSRVWDDAIMPFFTSTIRMIIKLRYLVALATLMLFAGSGYLVKEKMSFILFPPDAIDTFNINIETPIGTPIDRTIALIKPIEHLVSQLPKEELMDFTSQVGKIGDGGINNSRRGSEYAMITVYLTAENERSRKAIDVINSLREKVGSPEGIQKITYERQRGGPPVGKAVSMGVRSDTYEKIMPVVQKIKEKLGEFEGVIDVSDSFIVGKQEVHVRIKESEASAAGLTMADIGTSVRSAFEGVVPTTIRSLDEEIDVRVTLDSKSRDSESTLQKLKITNQRGNLIPLPRVAKFEKSEGISTYEHENNRRQVIVSADVDTAVTNSREVNLKMKDWVKAEAKNYPEVQIFFGGEDADTKESFQSLIESFAFAFFGIVLLLILLFGNIYQPMLIATTIPLGVVSVIWAFFIHGKPLTFLAMVGVIALAGVIVNNAIVFMDFVNKGKQLGHSSRESIIYAAKRRLRPIFLTTVTTVVGILPTAYGIGGLDPFVVPIALALGWGLAFGSGLTLVVLPPLTAIMDDFLYGVGWITGKFKKKRSF